MPHPKTTIAAGAWPLVAARSGRRDPDRELARDSDPERQARYCQGFDPDWFVPALLAAKWRSCHYPLEATQESVQQWLTLTDTMRVLYLGPAGMPDREAKVEADKQNDLELIRQCRPDLVELAGPAPATFDDAVQSLYQAAAHARRGLDDQSLNGVGTVLGYDFYVRYLWAAWRFALPQYAPPSKPEVASREDADRAIDEWLRALDSLPGTLVDVVPANITFDLTTPPMSMEEITRRGQALLAEDEVLRRLREEYHLTSEQARGMMVGALAGALSARPLTPEDSAGDLKGPVPEATVADPSASGGLVTLNQAASAVHRTKRALEEYKRRGMPKPRVRGGGGKPNLYAWSDMRPWLQKTFDIPLPERFFTERDAKRN